MPNRSSYLHSGSLSQAIRVAHESLAGIKVVGCCRFGKMSSEFSHLNQKHQSLPNYEFDDFVMASGIDKVVDSGQVLTIRPDKDKKHLAS
jgi:hypothetical protein